MNRVHSCSSSSKELGGNLETRQNKNKSHPSRYLNTCHYVYLVTIQPNQHSIHTTVGNITPSFQQASFSWISYTRSVLQSKPPESERMLTNTLRWCSHKYEKERDTWHRNTWHWDTQHWDTWHRDTWHCKVTGNKKQPVLHIMSLWIYIIFIRNIYKQAIIGKQSNSRVFAYPL